ncbi:hypothetical protein ACLB2K_012753 [Fragaria x ananassa]
MTLPKPLPDSPLHRLNWDDPGRTNRRALHQQKTLDVNFLEDFTVYHFDIPGESYGSLNADRAQAVINASPPTTKKELQQLLRRINFLRRFISNAVGKVQPFSPLLKLQRATEFVWEPPHQQAFERIKDYFTNPPVLISPREGTPLKLYIAAADLSIGRLLAQDDENGMEHVVYYLSRVLTDCEMRYSPMEKLCLALFFTGCKLHHYMLAFTAVVIA